MVADVNTRKYTVFAPVIAPGDVNAICITKGADLAECTGSVNVAEVNAVT